MNGLENTWGSKIATTNWKIGELDIETARYSPIKEVYNYEINNPSTSSGEITYEAKIGLMYASDYGYAASPANWSTNIGSLNNDTNRNNNWMFMGLDDWTISRTSDTSDGSWFVDASGGVYIGVGQDHAVRPTFYLNSNVTYVSGFGTSSDPIRIN